MNNIACYVRVSTDKADQMKSLEQQKILLSSKYSDKEILMYYDTGSGTSFKREGFQKLIYDAGFDVKIDGEEIRFKENKFREPLFKEIHVVSTSRFARHTKAIDLLRELWDKKKVAVIFDDINKRTDDMENFILLGILFTLNENESAEISKRTKRGNETSIIQNRIRNNSIFGWDFDRETNSLIANENEKKVVEFIFNTALNNGLKLTAKLTNEMGYRTKKGNLWSDSTIKTLITNPKYKGFNVRNKFNSVNLFTESKVKYVPKNNWIVKQNDRIEPLVSEELWEEVQQALSNRCTNGNRGQNARIYDTRGKIKCKCGANFVRCVTTRVANKPPSQHYLICGDKKKHGKAYCNAENITVGMLDNFIEEQRENYYKNIQLQIQVKIIQLQQELDRINNNEVFDIKDKQNELEVLKGKLDKLIDTFLSSSETMQKVVEKKIGELESKIKRLELEISNSKSINFEKEKYIRQVNNKISKLKLELENANDKKLTRQEWLDKVDKIVIENKISFKVVYNLD